MPFSFRYNKLWFGLIVLVICSCMCACQKKENTLESQIKKIARNQDLQSEQGLDMLATTILENPEAYRAYIKGDGSIDLDKLNQTVNKLGKKTDPQFNWDMKAYGGVPSKPLRINLFLERSGSMTGYDARSTNGDFKRTLNELITRFPRVDGNPGSIYIVNDEVYPFTGSLEDFVQSKDIFAATASTGDPSFTDFAKIFEYLLKDNVAENINVLVSDLIYSPEDTKGLTPGKIFNEEQGLATSIFQKHSDKSVVVVKLEGDFDGLYYPYNSPQAGVRYKGNRPYYAVIVGSAAAIYKLLHDDRYKAFTDFSTLPGYRNEYIFSRHPLTLSYYSLMPRGKGNKGSYSLGSSDDGEAGAHTLKEIKGDGQGIVTFRIAANLSNIPAPEDYITNPANYQLKGASGLKVLKVEPITQEMIDPRTRRFMEPATHLLTIEMDARHHSKHLEISLVNSLPRWIAESASADDSNLSAPGFATTTFGVDKLLEGIYRAYHPASSTPVFFTLHISLD